MRKKTVAFAFFLAVFLTFANGVFAQSQITTGVIQGTVMDPAGAVLPGVNIQVKNLDTNFTKTLSTDTEGRFVFLQLPPGHYSITLSKQGFATAVQENTELTVGQTIALNLNMQVSGTEERVTISAAPILDTTQTESSSTLNSIAVSQTPILGRKFEDLLTLTPGVAVVQGPDGDEITFAGQRGIFNNVSLDGGDYNNGFFGEQAGGQRAAIDITLEAVKEFQVVAGGASAEFGRTAGAVINVITKSGTNEIHGSLFHYQRLEALTADTSDGKPLKDFHREQFGGTIGGPIVKDKIFFFGAFEQILENLTRDNLSAQVGPTPCPVQAPTITANAGLINTNTDCQRLALLNFLKNTRNQNDGLPVSHQIHNSAVLAKLDWNLTPSNKLAVSYNFDRSNNPNQTFDVATYGNSANGTEGPSHIQTLNFNLFSTLSATKVNEAHFSYSRETRPREAAPSNIPADTAMGFAPTFRVGDPFFLAPNVDELEWRTEAKDNLSIVHGAHTVKVGFDWLHTRNIQVFRGFFLGRYIFDSVSGFLHYASPASLGAGFGPNAGECPDGSFTSLNSPSCSGSFSPLLLFLQSAGLDGPATDAAGFSNVANEDFGAFAQDKWQIRPNFTLSYGLRWEAQTFPKPVIPPSQTAYGAFLNNPAFPSDGTLHNQWKEFQPRLGFAWDITGKGRSILRASTGIYNARQNMLSQVGSITTNGVQQQTITGVRPVWPNLASITPVPPGTFPLFSGVRVFSKDYANPRIYTTDVAYEQQIGRDWSAYADFTWSKGVHITRFIENINTGPVVVPQNGDTVLYTGTSPFAPQLGSIFVTSSNGKSLYRGLTVGVKKRFSRGFQLEANYVYSKDMDDDSNERDPFTDRTFNRFDLSKDYSLSDRDEPHKFNFYMFGHLPWGIDGAARIQAHSAQPITDNPLGNGTGAPCSPQNSLTRVVNGIDCGRNHLRKDNQYFSLDWRLMRPIKFGDRFALIPTVEMFNTFNNANNINPLVTPGLFNFDGFLRQGVGDPREVQLSLKFSF